MSNLLQADRIETIIVPISFNAASRGIGNFALPFQPNVIQLSCICNFTVPNPAELVLFRINGRAVGTCFTNGALQGLSNPIYFKNEAAKAFWGQCEIYAYDLLEREINLTGSMVFIATVMK